jgi:hypothetical protein
MKLFENMWKRGKEKGKREEVVKILDAGYWILDVREGEQGVGFGNEHPISNIEHRTLKCGRWQADQQINKSTNQQINKSTNQ